MELFRAVASLCSVAVSLQKFAQRLIVHHTMDELERPLTWVAASVGISANLLMLLVCFLLFVSMVVNFVKNKKGFHFLRFGILCCLSFASLMRAVGCVIRAANLWPGSTLWFCIQRGTIWQIPMYGWMLSYTFLLLYIMTFNGKSKIENIALPIAIVGNFVFDIVHLTLNITYRALELGTPLQQVVYYIATFFELTAYSSMGIALLITGFWFVALLLRSPSIRVPGPVRDLPLVYLIVKMAVSTVSSGVVVLSLIFTGILEAIIVPPLGLPLWVTDSVGFYLLYRALEICVSTVLLVTVFLKADPLIKFIRAQNKTSNQKSFSIVRSTSSLGVTEKDDSPVANVSESSPANTTPIQNQTEEDPSNTIAQPDPEPEQEPGNNDTPDPIPTTPDEQI